MGITLTQEETNRQRVLQADAQGEYTFGALPPGPYRIEIAKQNFRTQSQQFTLNVNEAARIDVVMQPGSQGERTEVTDVVEPLKTGSVSLGAVIDQRSVRALPLDGRNFYELVTARAGNSSGGSGIGGIGTRRLRHSCKWRARRREQLRVWTVSTTGIRS